MASIAIHKGVVFALLAAALFGAGTPFAKSLAGQVEPVMLAGLLYLGSGVGLPAFYVLLAVAQRARKDDTAGLPTTS